MKKLLLATTILVTAGTYAAADVSVLSDGRMGVVSDDGTTTLSSRMRIKFSGSGITDGGLSFGGLLRAADLTGASSGTKGSTFISGALSKIATGDSGNVVDSLVSNNCSGLWCKQP